MNPPRTLSLKTLLGCLALVAATASCAQSQNGLTYLNGPKGGQIVFGALDGGSSAQEGMGDMLRHIHGHYGDKPKVGKVFGDKSGTTVAAFFTVTAKTDHNRQIAGLLIVSSPPGGERSAAVLTDDAKRFRSSLGPMLKTLDAKSGGGAPAHTAKTSGKSAPLSTFDFPDSSGSIKFPAGWHVVSAHGGAIIATGPKGEKLNYGIYLPVLDPSTPSGRQAIMSAQRSGRGLPGSYVAMSYGTDPGEMFQSICYQISQKAHRQAPSITVKNVKTGSDEKTGNYAFVEAIIDNHDQYGPLHTSAELVIGQPGRYGSWGIMVYQTAVPVDMVEQERPTMTAVARSYHVDLGVMNRESGQKVQDIKTYAAGVLQRGRESQARTDEVLREGRQTSDSNERGVQGFCNNLLEQSVVTDTETGEHKTLDNDLSGLLVGVDPDRFQYVATRNYLKGIDY